jgi:hypothetical protein
MKKGRGNRGLKFREENAKRRSGRHMDIGNADNNPRPPPLAPGLTSIGGFGRMGA